MPQPHSRHFSSRRERRSPEVLVSKRWKIYRLDEVNRAGSTEWATLLTDPTISTHGVRRTTQYDTFVHSAKFVHFYLQKNRQWTPANCSRRNRDTGDFANAPCTVITTPLNRNMIIEHLDISVCRRQPTGAMLYHQILSCVFRSLRFYIGRGLEII